MSSRTILSVCAALAAVLLLAMPVAAQDDCGVTEAEAVGLAFPGCEIARAEVALTEAQQGRVKKSADVCAVPAKVVRYEAKKKGVVTGYAYVDTRRVRTQAQTLLVVVDVAGAVQRIELLEWHEPRQYRPRPAFWAQFHGKKLDGTLQLRRGVRPVTGATLSARTAVDAVRTSLAVHAQLGSPPPAGDS